MRFVDYFLPANSAWKTVRHFLQLCPPLCLPLEPPMQWLYVNIYFSSLKKNLKYFIMTIMAHELTVLCDSFSPFYLKYAQQIMRMTFLLILREFSLL